MTILSIELVDEQLNILLNTMHLDGERRFSVRSPILDADLFDVELGRREWKCVPSHDKDEFKDVVAAAKGEVDAAVVDEIPGYDALRNVVVASGASDDWQFGSDLLHALKKIQGNPGKYSICLDTNVLYNRFVSSVLCDKLGRDVEIVLSNMVVEEVREKANERYDRGWFDEGLEGQYTLDSREAKIAMSELDFIDEEMRTVHHGDEDFVYDNEVRDMRIVEEYEDSVESVGKKAMLFGFEKDFVDKVDDYDVDFVALEYPSDVFGVEVGCDGLSGLLRYCAQVFGVVEVGGNRVCGVWDGMTDEEFKEGKVVLDGGGLDEVRVSDAVREVVG